jgi:general secretion pathway protein G
MKAKSGFTLVEILIVVIILGILAAIVVPQFTDASTQAKVSSIKTDLQTVRSQVQLYKSQHNNGTLPGATTGVTFTQAMTGKTNADGTASTSGAYGPYLQAIPANPYVTSATDAITVVVATIADYTVTTGTTGKGWRFDIATGVFQSDYDATTAGY